MASVLLDRVALRDRIGDVASPPSFAVTVDRRTRCVNVVQVDTAVNYGVGAAVAFEHVDLLIEMLQEAQRRLTDEAKPKRRAKPAKSRRASGGSRRAR